MADHIHAAGCGHDHTRGSSAPSEAAAPDPAHGLLDLQQTAGNAAVTQAVAQRRAAEQAQPDHGAMVRQATSGGGAALDVQLRRDLEQHTGHDLSDVRVHTGGAASEAAKAVGAEAFTVGRDVVFGSGQYDPASAGGRHRLAHEVSHVVQQRQGPVSGTATGTGIALSDPADAFEQAAEASAVAYSTARRGPHTEA